MRVLVVDDEKPARDRLVQMLDELEGFEVAAEAANGKEAVALAAKLSPDIVLLDIRMPGLDGIETAHHLNAMQQPPAVVFATAYDEYAVAAFEARAIGYVLKPVRRERLERALSHAARLTGQMLHEIATESDIEPRRQHVCALARGELQLIPVGEVSYFSADQKYVCVHHSGGRTLIDDSLKSLEDEFADTFVRIHRGALVAVAAIERLEKSSDGKSHVVLRDSSHAAGDDLIISRRHVANVRRRLKRG